MFNKVIVCGVLMDVMFVFILVGKIVVMLNGLDIFDGGIWIVI